MRRNEAAGEQYDLQLLRRERRSRRRDEFDELSTTFPSPFGDELRLPPRLSHMSLQRPLPVPEQNVTAPGNSITAFTFAQTET